MIIIISYNITAKAGGDTVQADHIPLSIYTITA